MIPPVVEGDTDDDIYDGEAASVHDHRRQSRDNGDQQEENKFVTEGELPSEEDRKTFLVCVAYSFLSLCVMLPAEFCLFSLC